MTTSTNRAELPTPPAPDDLFARLVGLHRMYGQLAEFSRSHHGQDRTTVAFDNEVATYSDHLEERYPARWEQLWPQVVIDEAGMLHDPDTRPVLTCGLCQLQRRGQLTQRDAQRHPRPQPHSTGTPTSDSSNGADGQLGQVA